MTCHECGSADVEPIGKNGGGECMACGAYVTQQPVQAAPAISGRAIEPANAGHLVKVEVKRQ